MRQEELKKSLGTHARGRIATGWRAFFFACLAACSSSATPELESLPQNATVKVEPSQILSNQDGSQSAYSGVVRVQAAMVCSGFLVGPMSNPEAPAYVITSGHCVQDWDQLASSLNFQRNRPSTGAWTVSFRQFRDTPEALLQVPIAHVRFSTMRTMDLAVLELGTTLKALIDLGIQPLPLTLEAPPLGSPLRIVGIPEEGLAPTERYLRLHSCPLEEARDVIEGIWYWFQLHSNRCEGIRGGSSGSPLLGRDQAAFAITSTSTRGSLGLPCMLGHPCEVRDKAVYDAANTNYAMPLSPLIGCWNKKGIWQASLPSCSLRSDPTVTISSRLNHPIRTLAQNEWPLSVTGNEPFRRLKGRAGLVNCRDRAAYSAPLSRAKLKLEQEKLPQEEGVYLYCLMGSDGKYPSISIAHVDNTGPTQKPRFQIDEFPDEVSVHLLLDPPELSGFRAAWISMTESCAKIRLDAIGGQILSFRLDELPLKICLRAVDEAGNEGPLVEQIVSKRQKKKPKSQAEPRG